MTLPCVHGKPSGQLPPVLTSAAIASVNCDLPRPQTHQQAPRADFLRPCASRAVGQCIKPASEIKTQIGQRARDCPEQQDAGDEFGDQAGKRQ